MTTTPDFRAELEKLVDLYYALGGNWSPHGYTDTWNDALVEARTALATLPPLAPNYIDPEHHGEGRELLQVFYAACNAEGGTADEIHLRGIRAVMAARAALVTLPPEPPTDEERLADFTKWLAREMPPNTIIGDPLWWAPRIWCAALERWGQR